MSYNYLPSVTQIGYAFDKNISFDFNGNLVKIHDRKLKVSIPIPYTFDIFVDEFMLQSSLKLIKTLLFFFGIRCIIKVSISYLVTKSLLNIDLIAAHNGYKVKESLDVQYQAFDSDYFSDFEIEQLIGFE